MYTHKKIFIISFIYAFVLLNTQCLAQNKIIIEEQVYTQAEQMPAFNYKKYSIEKYIEMKTNLFHSTIDCTAYIACIIDEMGKIKNAQVINSSGNIKNDEKAIQILSKMPKWIPAKQNGKNCKVKLVIPVKFNINIKKDTEKKLEKKPKDIKGADFKYKGGEEAMFKFIDEKINTSDTFKKIHGTAFVNFSMKTDGTIFDVKLMKSCHNKNGDKIALRIILSMPKWIINNNKINKHTIAISFKGEKEQIIKSDKNIRAIVDEQPIYMGGEKALNDFIKTQALKLNTNKLKGKAFVSYIIDENGKAVDAKIIKSSGSYSIDKIIKKIICNMPKWRPGMQNGIPVKVKQNRPITI